MSEWKEVLATEYCRSVVDGTHDSPKQVESGRYLVTSKHIKGSSIDFSTAYLISEDDYQRIIKRSKVDQWDVIISMIGEYCGFCYLEDNQNTEYAVKNVGLLKTGNELNARWLYYYLNSPKGKLQLYMNRAGSTQPYISLTALRNLRIPNPTDKEKEKVTAILSSLDAKIENNNKVNAKLEEIAQNLFKEWFVDFGPFKDGKFVDSELGPIPEGWRVGLFSDTVDVMPGGTPKTDVEEYWVNGNIPFFSPKDAGTDVYCVSTEKAITMSGLNACSSRLYPKNTIFITARGTVGKVVMAACDMAMNQSNYAIKPKDNNNYYYTFLQTRSITEKLKHKSNGAVFSAIVTRDFDECIIIPDKSTENQFNTLISPIFSQIWNALQENQRLSTLRDTLLPKLMSGEIEV